MKKLFLLLALFSFQFVNAQTQDSDECSPEFPGGIDSMYSFIKRNMNYPTIEKDSGITGTVIVRFAITENGSVDFCKILTKSPKAFNDEVLRIMKLMPKWKPGKMNGKFVPVYFTLPFQFELEDVKPNNQTSITNSVALANKQEKNRLTGYIVITIVTVLSVILLKTII